VDWVSYELCDAGQAEWGTVDQAITHNALRKGGKVSIYQVPIKEWFCDEKSAFHEYLYVVEAAIDSGAACEKCGKPITKETGYCSHGIAYGFSEMYCCAKCAGYIDETQEEG
jgi:hypothetical protein